MSEIRLLAETELDEYARIRAAAYPGMRQSHQEVVEEGRRAFRRPHIHLLGLFEAGEMLGVMQHLDFEMTVLDRPVRAGGVGGVAVDLLHKKRRVAYRLLQQFVRRCRAQNQPLALLYPFRSDFYRRMGFGYGTKRTQYRVAPAGLPRTASIDHLHVADKADQEAILACYNRYAAATNGMIRRQAADFEPFFDDAETQCLVYQNGRAMQGYLFYRFRPGKTRAFFDNDLQVQELVYETPAALAELLTFLSLQTDQATRVVFTTQDEFFMQLLDDPRNDSNHWHEVNTQSVNWMPRVVDVPGLFAALQGHDFNGQSVRLCLDLLDDFLPENQGETVIHFEKGEARVVPGGERDVTLRLHVRDFSPLVLGVVHLKWLVQVGLAAVDVPDRLETVHRLFAWDQKPICLTLF